MDGQDDQRISAGRRVATMPPTGNIPEVRARRGSVGT